MFIGFRKKANAKQYTEPNHDEWREQMVITLPPSEGGGNFVLHSQIVFSPWQKTIIQGTCLLDLEFKLDTMQLDWKVLLLFYKQQ